MPPKPKITRDMIIDAAIQVVRKTGYESINTRTVSGQLHCSTQPVMYHFSTIDSLKRAAYAQTDQMHTEYLMIGIRFLGSVSIISALQWKSRSCSASCFNPDMRRRAACLK